MSKITTLFFDVGGVILTNGWDSDSRQRAAEHFSLKHDELEARHESCFEILERGQMSRDEYLQKLIFYEHRPFSREDFIKFMEAQSRPHEDTLKFLQQLAKKQQYLLATINNESLELNQYRIEKFGLRQYFTAFFSSSFLGVRKPEAKIFEIALHVLQRQAAECLFLDDREENIQAAAALGINSFHVIDVSALEANLEKLVKADFLEVSRKNRQDAK